MHATVFGTQGPEVRILSLRPAFAMGYEITGSSHPRKHPRNEANMEFEQKKEDRLEWARLMVHQAICDLTAKL